MRKFLILILLINFCGGGAENENVDISSTSSTTIPSNTTLFTDEDSDAAFSNFVNYWSKNLKVQRPISNEDLKKTNSLGEWPESILINGSITCNLRVKGTLTTGVADEIHPIEFDSYQNLQWWLVESYVCDDDLITNLYGPPFYQDNEWWIFAATKYPENLGTDSLYKECGYPCSPVSSVRFATRINIDLSKDD